MIDFTCTHVCVCVCVCVCVRVCVCARVRVCVCHNWLCQTVAELRGPTCVVQRFRHGWPRRGARNRWPGRRKQRLLHGMRHRRHARSRLEPPLGAETCETTDECAALCRSSRSIVFIQSLIRIDCCHVRSFAQAMTEEEPMTKDKDQKNRGSKTNTKSADHILYGPARVLDSKKAQLHQKTAVAPGCV